MSPRSVGLDWKQMPANRENLWVDLDKSQSHQPHKITMT